MIYQEEILDSIFQGLAWYNNLIPVGGADKYGFFEDRYYVPTAIGRWPIGKYCLDYPYPGPGGPAPFPVYTADPNDKDIYTF
jgi:hypothetical protein